MTINIFWDGNIVISPITTEDLKQYLKFTIPRDILYDINGL